MVKTSKNKTKPKKLTKKTYKKFNKMKGSGPKTTLSTINEEQKKLFYDDVIKKHESIDSLLKKTNPVKKEILDFHKIYYPKYTKSELEKAIKNPENIKILAGKKSLIASRDSTMFYEGIKDYVNTHYEINQPEFTPEDQNKKEEIWLCRGGTSCFSDIKCDKNKGDHIYGVRERIKEGIIGSNSKWNMIPCTHNENLNWKKGPLDKNLVYDTFTKEEIDKFTDKQKDYYKRLQDWKKYCKERGAKLYWINGKEINKLVAMVISPLLQQMNTEINNLPKIPQDKQYSDDDDDDGITDEALLKALEEQE